MLIVSVQEMINGGSVAAVKKKEKKGDSSQQKSHLRKAGKNILNIKTRKIPSA
jgi:hypothetical protein